MVSIKSPCLLLILERSFVQNFSKKIPSPSPQYRDVQSLSRSSSKNSSPTGVKKGKHSTVRTMSTVKPEEPWKAVKPRDVNKKRTKWSDILTKGAFIPSTNLKLVGCITCKSRAESENSAYPADMWYKCDVCDPSSSTKGLKKHYERKHAEELPSWWGDYIKTGQRKLRGATDCIIGSTRAVAQGSGRHGDVDTSRRQPKLSEYICTADVQRRLDNGIAKWIVVGRGCPAAIVDDVAWRKFMRNIVQKGYQHPSRTKMARLADQAAECAVQKLRASFIRHVSAGGYFSICIDGWSNIAKFQFEGLLGFYRDSRMVLHKVVLGLVPNDIGGKAVQVRDVIVQRLRDLVGEDGLARLTGLTTDGPNAMLKLRTLWPFASGYHIVCPAHKIQNLITPFVTKLERGSYPTSLVNTVLHKVQDISTLMQKPGNFIADYRAFCATQGKIDKVIRRRGDTRWNITLGQLKDYAQIEPVYRVFVEKGVSRYAGEVPLLDATESACLHDMIALLEPLGVATRLMETDSYIGVSGILFVIMWIRWQLEADPDDTEDIATLRRLIREKSAASLEASSFNLPFLRVVTLFDVRFKNNSTLMTEAEREVAKKTIMTMMQLELGEACVPPKPADEELLPMKRQKTLQDMMQRRSSRNTPLVDSGDATGEKTPSIAKIAAEVSKEWEKYDEVNVPMEEKDLHSFNLGDWWHVHRLHFPRLYTLAQRVLSLAVSGSEAERLFSRAAFISIKARNRLRPERVERLVMGREALLPIQRATTRDEGASEEEGAQEEGEEVLDEEVGPEEGDEDLEGSVCEAEYVDDDDAQEKAVSSAASTCNSGMDDNKENLPEASAASASVVVNPGLLAFTQSAATDEKIEQK